MTTIEPPGPPRPEDVYHAGELEMQRAFDVEARGAGMAMNIVRVLSDKHLNVLAHSDLMAVALIDDAHPVTELLTGAPGFLGPDGTRTVVEVRPEHPLPSLLHTQRGVPFEIGTLAVDFVDKGRVRVNGIGTVVDDGLLTIAIDHVFPNCKSHVLYRKSTLALDADGAADREPSIATADGLGDDDIAFAHRTETLFLATSARVDGDVDVAYRGGPHGFVTATTRRLEFVEYRGNDMFQSLGNLHLHRACSVSLVSLRERRLVAVMGQGRLERDGDSQSVVVDVERVVSRPWPSRRLWEDVIACKP